MLLISNVAVNFTARARARARVCVCVCMCVYRSKPPNKINRVNAQTRETNAVDHPSL